MNSLLAIDKIELRLNKLASNDYQSIDTWKKEEALNKAVYNWLNRQFKGRNLFQEGDEENISRVDDLSCLLRQESFDSSEITKRDLYSEISIPDNYLRFKRLYPKVKKEECEQFISSKLIEEANVSEYLGDYLSSPSFEFEETFHTILNKQFHIYHNKQFSILNVNLVYYKKPEYIHVENKDKAIADWEFPENVCEEIIDEAVKILAGDTENTLQYELANKRTEENN